LREYRTLILIITIIAAICVRLIVFSSLDRLLPMEGLYVDEKTFSCSPFVSGIEGFSRPPAMFLLTMLLGFLLKTSSSRIALALISLLPGLALYLAFRKKEGILLYTAGLLLSPFLILYGLGIMPAIPAAALIAFSILQARNGKTASAGFLTGIAILFRAELALAPLILLIFAFRKYFRSWLIFTASAAIAVLPVIVLNLFAGAGPVIAANGGENLWLGTEWELIRTPPGVEFEQLVSTGDDTSGGDRVFLSRALDNITNAPLEWLKMGGQKILAFFTLPGPGRNYENSWLLSRTGLIFLLPLTLMAMSAGIVGALAGQKKFWQLAAAAFICTGIFTSFIFFPSARFRTAIPAEHSFPPSGSLPYRSHMTGKY